VTPAENRQPSEILSGFYPRLSVAGLICLCLRGLVADFGFGVVFERGEVTALAADFAVGGFAGPRAGAVVAGFVDAGRWLRPMLGFFHPHNVRCRTENERQVFIPWLTRRRAANVHLR